MDEGWLMTAFKSFFDAAIQADPFMLLIVFVIALCGFVVFSVVGMLRAVILTPFSRKMNVWTSKIHTDMSQTRSTLSSHATNVKNTATNFDASIETVRQELDASKVDLTEKMQKLTKTTGELTDKLATIGKLSDDLKVLAEKITVVEKRTGEAATVDDLTKIYTVVKSHNAILEGMKKK
jgi:hypothetical protein